MSLPGTLPSLWRLASPWTRALVAVLLLALAVALGYGLWRASHAPEPTPTEGARAETDAHREAAARTLDTLERSAREAEHDARGAAEPPPEITPTRDPREARCRWLRSEAARSGVPLPPDCQ